MTALIIWATLATVLLGIALRRNEKLAAENRSLASTRPAPRHPSLYAETLADTAARGCAPALLFGESA